MPKRKRVVEEPSPLMNILTRPWFVLAIIGVCFGILTPKIFLPLFRQLFGLVKLSTPRRPDELEPIDRNRLRPPAPQASVEIDSLRSPPRPAPGYQSASGGSGKSMLTFLLPIYAVGIGLYLAYTLFKVYNKKKEDADDDEESADEESRLKTRTVRFKENNFPAGSNLSWDPVNGEFKIKRGDDHFARSEESEDELDDYARYSNLDPDYVEYLKELRRAKRYGDGREHTASKRPQEPPISKEIPLTPNIGLTNITNTNVLLNDTLEQMKNSLNKINLKLARKKAVDISFEDQEIEELQKQLSQTESQMAKILKIVNTASESFNHTQQQQHGQQQQQYDECDSQSSDWCGSEDDDGYIQEHLVDRSAAAASTAAAAAAAATAVPNSRTSSQSSISSESMSTRSSSSCDEQAAVVVEKRKQQTEKQALDQEGLRKRRLKKKNYRKRAKNKKNQNKASKKED